MNFVKLFAIIFLASFLCSTVFAQKKISEIDYVTRATSLLQERKISEAMTLLDEVLKINPGNPAALYLRGTSKFLSRDFNGALVDYNKIINLAPKTDGIERVYNNRGVLLHYSGEKGKALADFNKAISINPNYPEPYNGRGNIFSERDEWEKAFSDYDKAIKLNPKSIPAYDGRAYIYFVKGDLDKSLNDLDKALEFDPNVAATILKRGMVLGLKGYWFASADNLKKAIELNANSTSMFSGNISVSLSDFDKYVTANPKNANAFAIRGFIKLIENKENESLVDFKKAFELDANLRKDLDLLIEPIKNKLND